MRDIKKDVVYGKKHENKIKPTIDKIFGELTLSEDPFANFDFYNNNYYVEHKKRSIVSDKYGSLYFDKVKYDKNGDLALKINYEFNSKNQVIHKTEFDESNEEKQEIYDYNTNGFVSEVKVIEYDYRGREETTIFTFDYKIDSYKNWTIQNTYENNELVLISERKIDYY